MNVLIALSQEESARIDIYGSILSDELIKRGNNVYIITDNISKKRSHAEYIELNLKKDGLFEKMAQVNRIIKIIKENDIHIVHINSKDIFKVCSSACKSTKIPLITTIHGKQQFSQKDKINKTFGDYSIALCENVAKKAINIWGLEENRVGILRDMIDTDIYIERKESFGDILDKKIITISGKLTGMAGETTFKILDILSRRSDLKIQIMGDDIVPDRFKKFIDKVDFLGFPNNVIQKISESSLVIGSGRVIVEAILNGVPAIAVGEKEFIGMVNESNLEKGLNSNFAKYSLEEKRIYSFENVMSEIQKGLKPNIESLNIIREVVINEYSKQNIMIEIEEIYRREYLKKQL